MEIDGIALGDAIIIELTGALAVARTREPRDGSSDDMPMVH